MIPRIGEIIAGWIPSDKNVNPAVENQLPESIKVSKKTPGNLETAAVIGFILTAPISVPLVLLFDIGYYGTKGVINFGSLILKKIKEITDVSSVSMESRVEQNMLATRVLSAVIVQGISSVESETYEHMSNLQDLKDMLWEEKKFLFSKKDKTPISEFPLRLKKIKQLENRLKDLEEELSLVTDEALRYYDGDGVDQDFTKALEYFQIAADQGDGFAQAMVGKCHYEGTVVDQDFTEAVKYFQYSAMSGNVDGWNSLGACYYEGKGVMQSYKLAFKCFQEAAKQNDPDALFMIGLYYYEGRVVEQNFATAVRYFALSNSAENSEQEFVEEKSRRKVNLGNAETYLGLAYLLGRGKAQNYKKAYEHLNSASNKGNEYAQFCKGYCFDNNGKAILNHIQDLRRAL